MYQRDIVRTRVRSGGGKQVPAILFPNISSGPKEEAVMRNFEEHAN